MADSSTKLRRPPRVRMIQNFHIIWLDENIDENHHDCRKSIAELREVGNTVNTFINIDDCIDFITDMVEETAFMLVSEVLSQDVIPVVQDIFQLKSVYIICKNTSKLEKWDKKWTKIKGVYKDLTLICKRIREDSEVCERNAVSISFIKQTDDGANQNLDTLDCLFMYTEILKDILLTIDFKQENINQFLIYCREQFADSTTNLEVVNKIESEYYHHSAIWWYTSDTFLYGMLNRALRVMDVDVIVKIGFFLRDLHQDITKLHVEQFGERNHSNSFTVYRGQGMTETDFNQLKNTQGGLLSFNNFLSTSYDREVSAMYAESNLGDRDLIGILSEITVDPSVFVTSFANVKDMSYYEGEEEILFAMHSIFRIGEIQQLDGNERFWQVRLTLTSDNDAQLQNLTKRLQEETSLGSKGWLRLGQLMVKLGQFDKAEELYRILLEQTNNQSEKAHLYQMLGMVNDHQGNYAAAVACYNQSLQISKNVFSSNHPYLVSSYSNIGGVYDNMGEYSKALEYHKRSLDIRQELLPKDHFDLATSYNNMGKVYKNMGEYSKALEYYEKSLKICQNALPGNHPYLAASYNNIGMIYQTMSDYLRALNYYQKGLEIEQKTLPRNHPDFAISYDNIGLVYMNMGEHTKALEYHQKSLDNRRKSLSVNHPYLANSYNSIGLVYDHMGEYSTAIEYYEQSLDICQNALPGNHPYLATCYNNIGLVYMNMDQFAKALEYYLKCLNIRRKSLSANHPDLANSYNNIGTVYMKMGDYSKAPDYYEKALEIHKKTLPAYHPDFATSYNNIGGVYFSIGEYSKALECYESSLDIRQKILPANHPLFGTSYNNIGNIYYFKRDYAKALTYFARTLEIWKRSLPTNHPQLEKVRESIKMVEKKL